MTATDTPRRVGNPYVGPASFGVGDPLYGRDQERGDLVDLLDEDASLEDLIAAAWTALH